MRITELLESLNFKESDFVEDNELAFDLVEDLSFFMNHDDDTYRRHVYPAVIKYVDGIKQNKNVNPLIFKTATTESYKSYCQKFPIRQLPDSLDEEVINEVCKKFYEDMQKYTEEGKFKD